MDGFGMFSPPTTRSGKSYSLPAYPAKRRLSPLNQGFFDNHNQNKSHKQQQGQSYSSVVRSSAPIRGNRHASGSHQGGGDSSRYFRPSQAIPYLPPKSINVENVYQEMLQCFTQVHQQIHSDKSGLITQIKSLDKMVNNDLNGVNALSL